MEKEFCLVCKKETPHTQLFRKNDCISYAVKCEYCGKITREPQY